MSPHPQKGIPSARVTTRGVAVADTSTSRTGPLRRCAIGESRSLRGTGRAAAPTAGAIAGVVFSLLFAVSATIIFSTITDPSADVGEWLEGGSAAFSFAIGLVPFAGIFFLWFMAVARERLGSREDRFFSTVFLGSGLLFLALVFAAAASSAALVASYARDPSALIESGTFFFARNFIAQTFGVYALRMAAVFVFSQATLWVRTGVMPRWLAFVSYALGLALLFAWSQSVWAVLVFPAWVLLVSVYFLVRHPEPEPDVPM